MPENQQINDQPIISICENGSLENEELHFNLGATFENVFLDTENNYTLKDFFEYMKTFLNKPFFIQYSENQPLNDSIKVWYDITEETVS